MSAIEGYNKTKEMRVVWIERTLKRAGVRPASCQKIGLNDWKLRKPGGDLKKAFLVQLLLYDVGSHLAPAWTKKLLFYAFLPLMRPRHQVRPTGGSSAATHRAEGIICQDCSKKELLKLAEPKSFYSVFLPPLLCLTLMMMLTMSIWFWTKFNIYFQCALLPLLWRTLYVKTANK